MLASLERPKIRDVVARRLRAFIAEEGLKPGDRLPTETELARQFGVSRLSLREATKSLEFLGIVQAKPGCGLTVGRVSLERVTEYLGFHPALQSASAEELVGTRIVVELGVLPYVMKRMKAVPAIHASLAAINEELKRAGDPARCVELDIAFHRRLVESSGLAPVAAFHDLLSVFFQRFRNNVKRAEWKQGAESHRRLLDSLGDEDLPSASEELRRHIESHTNRAVGKRVGGRS